MEFENVIQLVAEKKEQFWVEPEFSTNFLGQIYAILKEVFGILLWIC